MAHDARRRQHELFEHEWVSFPGGELEGERPRVLCAECRRRAAHGRGGAPRTLCFACYRAGLERERALAAAARVDTASEARFQEQLPFEPLDAARLARLKAERATARGGAPGTVVDASARFAAVRRRAQMAARRAIDAAWRAASDADRARVVAAAIHAAELQLPESWLPFVVAR